MNRRRSLRAPFLRLAAVFAACAAIAVQSAGCSSARKKPEGISANPPSASVVGPEMGPPEAFGPFQQQDLPANAAYGPEPVRPRPLVLVLGSGLARGYAHFGVLRALKEEKIPVGAIVGAEIGGLIGVLYARDANVNQTEWALQRFRPEIFSDEGFLPAAMKQQGRRKKLDEALVSALGQTDLAQLKLPVHVVFEDVTSGRKAVELIARGSAAQAIRATLAVPGLFSPVEISPGRWGVAPPQLALPVREARSLDFGPVVVVDVAELPSARRSAAQSGGDVADLVIRPDLTGIRSADFSRRTEAVYRGKQAVKDSLIELKRLTGEAR